MVKSTIIDGECNFEQGHKFCLVCVAHETIFFVSSPACEVDRLSAGPQPLLCVLVGLTLQAVILFCNSDQTHLFIFIRRQQRFLNLGEGLDRENSEHRRNLADDGYRSCGEDPRYVFL